MLYKYIRCYQDIGGVVADRNLRDISFVADVFLSFVTDEYFQCHSN